MKKEFADRVEGIVRSRLPDVEGHEMMEVQVCKYYLYMVIDQAFSVKMAGYLPIFFFFFFGGGGCLRTDMESWSIHSQKKEQGQYPANLTKKAWFW